MNCPNCGSSVNQEGAFCVVCGTKLINPNVQNGNYINSGVQPNNGFVNPSVQPNNGFVNPSVQPNNGFVNPSVQPNNDFMNPGVQPNNGFVNPSVQANNGFVNPSVQANNGFVNPSVQPNNGFMNPVVQPNNGFVNPTSNVKGAFNKYSIISVVFSSVSLFIFWWLAIAGISLGVQSLRQIKEKNEKGKALSIIGIIIGSVSISLFVIGIILNIIAL